MQECHNLSDLVIGGRYIESLRDPGFVGEVQPTRKIISPTGVYNPDEFEEEEIEVIIDQKQVKSQSQATPMQILNR